jgi:hypothetical protein
VTCLWNRSNFKSPHPHPKILCTPTKPLTAFSSRRCIYTETRFLFIVGRYGRFEGKEKPQTVFATTPLFRYFSISGYNLCLGEKNPSFMPQAHAGGIIEVWKRGLISTRPLFYFLSSIHSQAVTKILSPPYSHLSKGVMKVLWLFCVIFCWI